MWVRAPVGQQKFEVPALAGGKPAIEQRQGSGETDDVAPIVAEPVGDDAEQVAGRAQGRERPVLVEPSVHPAAGAAGVPVEGVPVVDLDDVRPERLGAGPFRLADVDGLEDAVGVVGADAEEVAAAVVTVAVATEYSIGTVSGGATPMAASSAMW
nr:hypothetical protein [Nocardia brevicatena]